jgi:hypothetical protein
MEFDEFDELAMIIWQSGNEDDGSLDMGLINLFEDQVSRQQGYPSDAKHATLFIVRANHQS